MGVGLAQGAYDLASAYAREREQFGKPIGTFQAVAFKLADMAVEIEAGRQLVYKAAWLKDQGRPFALEAAMAKLYTGELSHRVVNAALQIHGGYGFMDEFPISRLYRDQKILEIGEGTNEVQRMVIASSSACPWTGDAGRMASNAPTLLPPPRPCRRACSRPHGASSPCRRRHVTMTLVDATHRRSVERRTSGRRTRRSRSRSTAPPGVELAPRDAPAGWKLAARRHDGARWTGGADRGHAHRRRSRSRVTAAPRRRHDSSEPSQGYDDGESVRWDGGPHGAPRGGRPRRRRSTSAARSPPRGVGLVVHRRRASSRCGCCGAALHFKSDSADVATVAPRCSSRSS